MTPKNPPPERRPLSFESARVASRLLTPLPPSVAAALPAKARRDHAALAERVQKLAVDRRRLAGEVAAAPAVDAEATAEAIRAGKEPPTLTEPALREQLAEAERLEVAGGEALRRSAVDLLNDAAPLLADVDATLTTRAVEDAAAIATGIEDLRRQVLALGALYSEQAWIGGVLFGAARGVPAYIERPFGLDRTAGALRALAETFAEEVRQRDERIASAAANREREADFAKREARDRAERDEADERERERRAEQEPSAEQPASVWGGRETLG
jgi:hypothetical protein